MASGTLAGTLKHLRKLFDDGTALGLGDGQLLARYAATREEAAFAALVARHGPMVLSTCRAILRHEPDIEDAFQATFLVLAKRARSIRAGDALGGWLHRVAYRIAIQAGAESRRRHHREAEAASMTPIHFTPQGPEPDVAAVVHEELDRLPDRERLPVVLCDLEGLTHEQAAAQLQWTGPTLRHRLDRGRDRLRRRLTRRGLTASAVGSTLAASTAGARAAVPASLARATLSAALGRTAPAGAAALAAALIRGMARWKLVVAAFVLGSIVAAALGAWRPAATVPQAVGEMSPPGTAKDAAKPAASESGDVLDVRGRVVDPRGRPVAGASVREFHLAQDGRPEIETTSGPDGRFSMRVRLLGIQVLLRQPGISMPWVIATAPGYGPGWASVVTEPGAPGEVTVRLAEDGLPIEGRIVDLEGRPVAGARVETRNLWFPREGSLAEWLDRAANFGSEGPWGGLNSLPASLAATTGPDGRFRLTDIGRDRLVQLLISGPTIATAQLYVANRDGAVIHADNPQALTPGRSRMTYYPRRFEYAALPTRPIEGTIRDRDTGRPIAGVKLEGMVYEGRNSISAAGVEATTDARGHYRLTGLPVGPSYRLFIEPGRGLPYPRASHVTPSASPRPDLIAFDVTLKRGVLVRGRVTDKVTGRPVTGVISPFTFSDNPHAPEFPGYARSREPFTPIGDDGRYEVVALPGRGIIACYCNAGHYRWGAGARAITHGFEPIGNSAGGFATLPSICIIDNYHVLAEIDVSPGVEAVTKDLQVEPGRTVTIRVEDPEGRPLDGTKARGLSNIASNFDIPQDSPTIEVHALDPSEPRRVTITHEGRKLMGSVRLTGDEAGPLTVRLHAYGIITGRIVDEDGRPRGGLALNSLGGFGPEAPADEGLLPVAENGRSLTLARDGRFRIEGLVPGLKYGARVSKGRMERGVAFRDVVVAPGEVKDLGDIKVVPPRPGE